MKNKRAFFLTLVLLLIAACGRVSQPHTVTPINQSEASSPNAALGADWTQISFDSLAPAGMNMQQCWNGMGMDDQDRIYIGFTSVRGDGREDFPVFRYDPGTGEKLFLGTFVDIVDAAGNSRPGESIPKGHTRMIYANGKIYMGSQSFHDLKWEIDSLQTYRGSHLFAFDTISSKWQDLSAPLPGGVITEHEGIISLNILPNENLLVGLAHPSSDIVLYDFQSNQLVKVIPGIPWKLGNPFSPEIIVAPSGNIYTYRGTEAVSQRNKNHLVWVYNIHSGEMRDTGFQMTTAFGSAKPRSETAVKSTSTPRAVKYMSLMWPLRLSKIWGTNCQVQISGLSTIPTPSRSHRTRK